MNLLGSTGLSRLPVALDNLELLVSHSTRRFDLARASAEFLRERYANRDRLKDVPPFESLPSASTSHPLHGALTRFRMRVSKDRVTMQMLRCIDSRELIQQATVVGKQLVMCSSSFLCALPSLKYRMKGDEFDRDSPFRVDDLWFAGFTASCRQDRMSALSRRQVPTLQCGWIWRRKKLHVGFDFLSLSMA